MVGPRDVPPLALDLDLQAIRVRHMRAAPRQEPSALAVGIDMQPVDAAHTLAGAVPHEHCAARFGHWILLGSLPHEPEIPGRGHGPDEQGKRAEQHGSMRVVAARVHTALIDRGIGQAGLLGNGQPVDVRPEQPPLRRRVHRHIDDQPSPVLPHLDLRAPRARGRPGFDLAPHDGEGLLFLEAQLRNPVQLFPELQHIRFRLARER